MGLRCRPNKQSTTPVALRQRPGDGIPPTHDGEHEWGRGRGVRGTSRPRSPRGRDRSGQRPEGTRPERSKPWRPRRVYAASLARAATPLAGRGARMRSQGACTRAWCASPFLPRRPQFLPVARPQACLRPWRESYDSHDCSFLPGGRRKGENSLGEQNHTWLKARRSRGCPVEARGSPGGRAIGGRTWRPSFDSPGGT